MSWRIDRRVITVAMTTSTALVIANPLAQRAPNAELRLRTMTVVSDAVFTDEDFRTWLRQLLHEAAAALEPDALPAVHT